MKTSPPSTLNRTPKTGTRRIEWPIVSRIGLTVVLVCTLIAAIRWAMNVTNANARQVSTNLTQMQDRFGQRDGNKKSSAVEAAPGPVLEPANESR